MDYAKTLADMFDLKEEYVANIIMLLEEGNTIPFIARYRKEMHGTMDDQTIRKLADKLTYLKNLDERREEVKRLITESGNMTDEILKSLETAATVTEIDDIYRPFRPKRKTRASAAKEKGLEPLADEILCGQTEKTSPETLARKYINAENDVEDISQAISGASDIIAERISDNSDVRRRIRNIVWLNGSLTSTGDEEKDSVYTMYYNFTQPLTKVAGHRVLAVNRGEKEGFLKAGISVDAEKPMNVIKSLYVKGNNGCTEIVAAAGEDAYTRLIFPSIERELRSSLTQAADESAIRLFGENLRQLLLQPPIKGKTAIGLDPGYRTGCKLAVVDATGKVLDTAVIYITHSDAQRQAAKQTLIKMITKYGAEIIAIGNGTASKETEMFVAEVLPEVDRKVSYMVVSEAGASVYSASKLAAEEMPDFDLTLRSAVSIARRLQDPLAELVKIEPKAIGVGQYQHDMPQKQLETALENVVEDCVNSVGADLNTASYSLLSHISGLSGTVCKNIVEYRNANGKFTCRAQLKKVAKLGAKSYEQCAGFLRIDGDEPLDNTGVHPESYPAAKALIKLLNITDEQLKKGCAHSFEAISDKQALAQQLKIGLPTLNDIIKELSKPARDPRDELPPPLLRTDVLDISDLKEGMVLKGTVRNVIDFGAFVDIGVHQDGLVHISQISDTFISHPSEKLSVGDVVTVKIIGVDIAKKRISLTMKGI